jgi:hypothetical protein
MLGGWQFLRRILRDAATVLVDPRAHFKALGERGSWLEPAVFCVLMGALSVGIAAIRVPEGAPEERWNTLTWLAFLSPVVTLAAVAASGAVVHLGARWMGGVSSYPASLCVAAYATVAAPVWAATQGNFFLGSLSVILWVHIVAGGVETVLSVRRQVVWNVVVVLVAAVFVVTAVAGLFPGT